MRVKFEESNAFVKNVVEIDSLVEKNGESNFEELTYPRR